MSVLPKVICRVKCSYILKDLFRDFIEKSSLYGRRFFDPIDRGYIELISRKYRAYIEEIKEKDTLCYPEKTLHLNLVKLPGPVQLLYSL